ncbi:MAG: hypothetical protein HDQ87_06250 [Clostridia bacterium]|nr:hypothetical protein [Clostridia bacterium]
MKHLARRLTGTLCAGALMLGCMAPALAKESPPPNASAGAALVQSQADTLILHGVCYEIRDGAATVTGIRTAGEVTVPETVQGAEVKAIGPYAFEDWDVDVLELPASIGTIDEDAFAKSTFGEIRFDGTLAEWAAMYNGTAGGVLRCTDGSLSLVTRPEKSAARMSAEQSASPYARQEEEMEESESVSEPDESRPEETASGSAEPAESFESDPDESSEQLQQENSQSIMAQEKQDDISYSLDADAVIDSTDTEQPQGEQPALDEHYTGLSSGAAREMPAEQTSKIRIVFGYSKLPMDDKDYIFKALLMKRLGDGRTVNVQDAYGDVGKTIVLNHYVQRDELIFQYIPAGDEAGNEYFLRYEMWLNGDLLSRTDRSDEVLTVTPAPEPETETSERSFRIIEEETGLACAQPKLQANAYFGMPVQVTFEAEEGREYRVTADVQGKYGTASDGFGCVYRSDAYVSGSDIRNGRAVKRFFFTLHLPEEYTDQEIYVKYSVDEIGDGQGAQYYSAKDETMFVRPEKYPMPYQDPDQKAKILTGRGGLENGTGRVLLTGRETVLPSSVSYTGLDEGTYTLTADLMDAKTHTAAGASASETFTAGKDGSGTAGVSLKVTPDKKMAGGQYYIRYRITGDQLKIDSGTEPFRRQTLEVQTDPDAEIPDSGLYVSGPREAKSGDIVKVLVYSPTEGIDGWIKTSGLEYVGHEATGTFDMSGEKQIILVGHETGSEIVYSYRVTAASGESASFKLQGANTNENSGHKLQASLDIAVK